MLVALLGLAAAFSPAPPARGLATAAHARSASPRLAGAWEKARRGNSDVPEIIMGKVRLALATQRTVGDEEEIIVLWNEFKKCYASKELAVQAAEKNSAVFNPQLNSPTKIKGTFKLLCDRLGKRDAQALIMKNPGVLVCSPASLKNESNESILKAADLVEVLEANKPLIKVIAGATGVLFIWFAIYGIAAKNYGPDCAPPPPPRTAGRPRAARCPTPANPERLVIILACETASLLRTGLEVYLAKLASG